MTSSECRCDGNENKYYSLEEYECLDKDPMKQYQSGKKDNVCYDVCEVYESEQTHLLETKDFGACKQKQKMILNPILARLMKKVEIVVFTINLPNKFVRDLIPNQLQEQYDSDMIENIKNKEFVDNVGKAKLVCGLEVNQILANVVNILAMILYAIIYLGCRKIGILEIKIDDEEIAFLQEKSKDVIDAAFDFGCSMGALNIYFNNIWNYFDYTARNHMINDATLMNVIKYIILFVIAYCNEHSNDILNLKYEQGDKIGGNGSGSYNEKYHFFYLVRFLNSIRTQANTIFNIDIEQMLNPIIFDKYTEIKRAEASEESEEYLAHGGNFYQKYRHCKKAYLSLNSIIKF